MIIKILNVIAESEYGVKKQVKSCEAMGQNPGNLNYSESKQLPLFPKL